MVFPSYVSNLAIPKIVTTRWRSNLAVFVIIFLLILYVLLFLQLLLVSVRIYLVDVDLPRVLLTLGTFLCDLPVLRHKVVSHLVDTNATDLHHLKLIIQQCDDYFATRHSEERFDLE